MIGSTPRPRFHPRRALVLFFSFAAAAVAQTPVPYTTINLRGTQSGDDGVIRTYRAYQNPGDVFRILCTEPCTADQPAIFGLYAGFHAAHQTVAGLFGVDSLAKEQPFDMFIDDAGWCGPAQPGVGGDSAEWAGFFSYSGMSAGSWACFWFAVPGHQATPFHYPETSTPGYQLLTSHEFTHTEFYSRHRYSYEDFAKAVSFYVAGFSGDGTPVTDACNDGMNSLFDGRLIWALCHRAGFQWSSLAPAFTSLAQTFDQGKGAASNGATSTWQFRKALNAVLPHDTMDAFLAAKASMVPETGDDATLPYGGGRVGMLGGWASFLVSVNALTSATKFHVDYPYGVTSTIPALATPENLYKLNAPGHSFFHFEDPVYLQLKYDPSLLPFGTDESTLALYSDNGTTFVPVSVSRVDPTKRVVSAEITSAGSYYIGASHSTVVPTTVVPRVLSTPSVRSRVVLRNPGFTTVTGTLRFRPTGAAASASDPSLPYSLPYRQTLVLDDAIAAFGAAANGATTGSVDVIADDQMLLPDVLATEIDAASGYVGSIVPSYSPAAGLRAGETGWLVAPGNVQQQSFRFLVRTGASGITFACVARDPSGATIATTTHAYAANTSFLVAPKDLGGGLAPVANESYEIDVHDGSALILTETSQTGQASHNYRIAERVDPEGSTAGDALHLPKAVSGSNPDGSTLRTTLQMTNPTAATLTGTVRFLPADGSGAGSFHYTIPPFATKTHSDVVATAGKTGAGALDLTSNSGVLPVALARIIHSHSGSGQGFQAAEEQTHDVMERLQAGDRVLLVAPVSTSTPFAIGVRTFGKDLALTITVNRATDGSQIKQFSTTVPANTTSETDATAFLGIAPPAGGILEIFVDGGGGLVYGTAANPATGAPNYQAARRLPYY